MKYIDEILVEYQCPFCGKIHGVHVSERAYYQWEDGALIQNVMPGLSATEREQIISHICPDCQTKVFGY